MNSIIEALNVWGRDALDLAWQIFWQSSLLIAVIFILDLVLHQKLRATVRYALWLALILKLLLPPSLALPTSAAWWLRPNVRGFESNPQSPKKLLLVVNESLGTASETIFKPSLSSALIPTTGTHLSMSGWALASAAVVSALLFGWMLLQWFEVGNSAKRAMPGPAFVGEIAIAASHNAKLRGSVQIKLTDRPFSPAVFGLFCPIILLPERILVSLSPSQLRAVLLHELFHIKRSDAWVNLLQTMLQIIYWWHPFLWLANARIRRLREEAVDDCVMIALGKEADIYAATLLDVLRITVQPPQTTLGLVAIMESKNSLHRRIERLIEFRTPKRSGLTLRAMIGILAFSCAALPMGQAPQRPKSTVLQSASRPLPSPLIPGDTAASNFATEIANPQPIELETTVEDSDAIKARPQPGEVSQGRETGGKGSVITTSNDSFASGITNHSLNTDRQPLFTRSYKLDPQTVAKNLKKIGSRVTADADESQSPRPEIIESALRNLLTKAGMDLSPPKGIFWNHSDGTLLVRTEGRDLGTAEQVLRVLNASQPLVHLQAKFIDIDDPAVGYIMQWLRMQQGVDAVTNSPEPGIWTTIDSSTPADHKNIYANCPIKNSLVLTIGGVLSSSQFRTLSGSLEQRSGVDLLGESAVTTLSGQQTQIQNVNVVNVVMAPDWTPQTPSTSTNLYRTELLPVGPTLDVIPYCERNDSSIRMPLLAGTETEFLGYDDPKGIFPQGLAVLPLPHFRLRQFNTSARLLNGQTLMIIGLAQDKDFKPIKESVRVAGKSSIGPLVRKASAPKSKRHLLLFITATLVDPDGNPHHHLNTNDHK